MPRRIAYGRGAIRELRAQLTECGVSTPLIVTDSGVLSAGVLKHLPLIADVAIFDQVTGNPTESDVLAGVDHYHVAGCDGIVAVGGGSVIDAAKVIGVLATNPLPLSAYDHECAGQLALPCEPAPVVAVPTTAGTGSEVGRGALIVMEGSGRKALIVGDQLIPAVAVLDPKLTDGLPPQLTAATGLDALSHCIEEIFCATDSPIIDDLAETGLRLIADALPRAVSDGSDRNARGAMMLASMYAGLGFQKGLGAVHALSHPLAAIGAHHGTANGILMPHVYRFNAVVAKDASRRISAAIGVTDAASWIEETVQQSGLPIRLREVGLAKAAIPGMAALAMRESCRKTNPRRLDFEEAVALYEAAW